MYLLYVLEQSSLMFTSSLCLPRHVVTLVGYYMSNKG